MIRKYLLLCLLLFPNLLQAQDYYRWGSFVVKGHLKNYTEPFFGFSITTYLDHVNSSVAVKADGSFSQVIPVQYRQDLHVILGRSLIGITVKDKDTISIDCDYTDVSNTFQIHGNNRVRTGELQLQAKQFFDFYQSLMDVRRRLYNNDLTAEQIYSLVNGLFNQNINAVIKQDTIVSDNTAHLITDLYFEYTYVLQEQDLIPRYQLKYIADTTANSYHFVLESYVENYKTMNEDCFWTNAEYRHFFYNYFRFFKPFTGYSTITSSVPESTKPGSASAQSSQPNVKPFNPTLDNYHRALSDIYFINIRDWFLTKIVTDDFGSYTFADVEHVYHMAIYIVTSKYLKDTLQTYYAAVKGLKPGKPAPVFTLTNEFGKTVSLSDYRRKVVYIDFWGVNCGPCIYHIKNFIPDLHKTYHDKDVAFINICVDSNEPVWKEALKKYSLEGSNLIAEGWTANPVCKAYNISAIPHYVLIDKNGNIVNNNATSAANPAIKDEIDALLK